MKIISVISISLVLVSCFQKKGKESDQSNTIPQPITLDTIAITDSTHFDNYSVEIDTAYFYARADSNTKMGTYLTKNDLTIICKKDGEFGYAVRLTDSVIEPKGWLKLRYLTQRFFTPPKITKE